MNQKIHAFGILVLSLILLTGCQQHSAKLHVYGKESNDLVRLLEKDPSVDLQFHQSPMDAVNAANSGNGLLILSEGYPQTMVPLDDKFYTTIKEKQLRCYIEFPSYAPGVELGDVVEAKAERAVVKQSSWFHGRPDSLQILGINGLHYISNDVDESYIVAAKVAGFDSAIYGLPDKSDPLFFAWGDFPVWIASTQLSRFVSGRYAPQEAWASLWESILSHVLPGVELQPLDWDLTVAASYGKTEKLPADFQRQSVQRGIEWYKNARMLVPDGYDEKLQSILDDGRQELAYDTAIPVGDGSNGVFECIFSEINETGNQPIGIIKRGDCISESAMAFATAGELFDNDDYKEISTNLLDFYLLESIATKKEYGDPDHPAYGLIPWGISTPAWFKASYGDDNARFALGALAAGALTGTDTWEEPIMKSMVALLRTTGREGFRGSRIDLDHFEENGWRYYRDRDIVNLAPHFEAYLWACYLWTYDQTGDAVFLNTAEKGIHTMMEHYPDGWTWTNGLAQERARMILPLAWLVRVKDNADNRAVLMKVVNDFLELQDETGAIREELGEIKMGRYPPPQSNAAYGTTEASLIAHNGDPVSDLLYTTNFALLGLHEAAHATGDATIKEAEDKLAEFLVRIQVKSEGHPELDGGWMRAFDFQRFEHWGSNADHGWGAWAIESGWTQGWITTILGLRELDTSVWDLAKKSNAGKYYPALKKEMLVK
ncbi:hypothetical protein KUV50_04325 [Membranicola marinus]|uniref:Uncharacterized protein n=1 Tax=Membranihabitans marinus TaxID=1227546 RepID=A0A953HS38_9BACT|nr:hypothetical protein [Membranihabitans marinus]MBY5957350.1 hypothetical protein [Membranihabitans marinus]